jgi:hypothetical protein
MSIDYLIKTLLYSHFCISTNMHGRKCLSTDMCGRETSRSIDVESERCECEKQRADYKLPLRYFRIRTPSSHTETMAQRTTHTTKPADNHQLPSFQS